MDKVLRASKFTNGADVEKVASLYRRFFDEVSKSVTLLEFRNPDIQGFLGLPAWDKEKALELAEALPFFTACQKLDLAGHPFGDEGAQALLSAIAQMPSLDLVVLVGCKFGDATLPALETFISRSNISKLWLSALSEASTESVRNAWQAAGKESCNLEWKSVHFCPSVRRAK